MALNLIRRGPRTLRLVPDKGTGWQNCLRPGNTSPYMGGVFLAVQATNCDGLRLIDWGGDRPNVEVFTGAVKAAQMVGNTATVIRVLNPTPDTEVIMHVVPIPPPCSIAGLLRRWVGGCRGADVDRFSWWRGADRKFRPGGHAARLSVLGHRTGAGNLETLLGDGDTTARVVQVPPVDQREPDCLPERGGATRRRATGERGYELPSNRHRVPRHGRCERALQGGQTRGVPNGVVPAVAQGVGC